METFDDGEVVDESHMNDEDDLSSAEPKDAPEIPLKKKTVLNETRENENAYENPANDVGGDVDKPQVETMISKNINKDQKMKA